MKLDHIGIAVRNLDEAVQTYEKLLNTPCYKHETVELQHVDAAFFKTGESKVELLGAMDSSSVIASFLDKRGEGIHHIAFETEDIYTEMERLQKEGFRVLGDHPQPGADSKLVVFLHPKGNHGVLIELCQPVSKK